jgi:hypothetical protein
MSFSRQPAGEDRESMKFLENPQWRLRDSAVLPSKDDAD